MIGDFIEGFGVFSSTGLTFSGTAFVFGMFESGAFGYVNVLSSAADAAWTRNEILNNNIANVDTPGFKRQDMKFESLLQNEIARQGKTNSTLDQKVADVDYTRLKPYVYTDNSQLSTRLDGNNVDIDVEEAELASNQLMYDGIIEGLNKEFERMKSVLSK